MSGRPNHVANYTRSRKRARPGFDPRIMEFYTIMRDVRPITSRTTSPCIPMASPQPRTNPGTKYGILAAHRAPDLRYDDLPFDLYTDLDHVMENPGTYVWILYTDGMFAAARTLTAAELHSKHVDIFMEYNKPVVAAGEMRVDSENTVLYNFNSGTFMARIMERQGLGSDDLAEYQRYFVGMLEQAGAELIVYAPERNLTEEVIADRETLERYRRLGYVVFFWDTRDSCRTVVPEEMRDYFAAVDADAAADANRRKSRRKSRLR